MDDQAIHRSRLYRQLREAARNDWDSQVILLARQYLDYDPDEHRVWEWLGTSLMQVRQYEAANEALTRALELSPSEGAWSILGFLGRNCKLAGDYARAEYWFRRLIDEFPTSADGYIYLGSFLGLQGRLRQAAEILEQGTRCEKGCIDEAWMLLGTNLSGLEEFERAAYCLREALRIDPDYEIAKVRLRDVVGCLKIQRQS